MDDELDVKESTSLLKGTESSSDDVYRESSESTGSSTSSDLPVRRRYIPLEPIMCFYIISLIIATPLYQFYVYNEIAKSHGIHNFVEDDERKNCNSSQGGTIDTIQKEANGVFVFLMLANTLSCVVPTLFLGSISDKFGRKVSLLITFTGLFVRHVIYVIVMQWELSFGVLYLANIIEGLTGYMGSALMSAFSILADITTPGKERAYRIAIIEGLLATSAGFALFGGGVWLRYSSFVIPMVFATLLILVTIVLVVIFIPRTNYSVNEDHQKKICSFDNIKRCFVFYYRDNGENRRNKLIVLQLIFALTAASLLGKSNVMILFLLNLPFCWTEIHINAFVAVQLLINWGCSIIILKIINRFISDVGVLVVGSIFAVGAYTLLGCSYEDWMVYLHAVIATFSVISVPMLRSIMSRLAAPDEQGALFAGVSCIESVFTAVAGLLFGIVYQLTVASLPGTVFLVVAGIMVIVSLASGFLLVMMKNYTYRNMEHIVKPPSSSSLDSS